MRNSLAIGAALAMMLCGCGGSEEPRREDPRPCTDGSECEGTCTAAADTPVGTTGLTGTCGVDDETSCWAVLEQGTVVATMCR